MELSKTSKELAKVLGTNVRCLQRCREEFPGECPTELDPKKWTEFLERNQRGPFSPQRHYGEKEEVPEARSVPGPAKEWKEEVRPFAERLVKLEDAFHAGSLSRDQYFEAGTEIVLKSMDGLMFKEWVEQNFRFVEETFRTPSDAERAHPEIMAFLYKSRPILQRMGYAPK